MLPTGSCEIPKCFFRFPIFAPPVQKILKTSKIFAPSAQKPSEFQRFSPQIWNASSFSKNFLRLRRKMLLLWNLSFHSYQVCSAETYDNPVVCNFSDVFLFAYTVNHIYNDTFWQYNDTLYITTPLDFYDFRSFFSRKIRKISKIFGKFWQKIQKFYEKLPNLMSKKSKNG